MTQINSLQEMLVLDLSHDISWLQLVELLDHGIYAMVTSWDENPLHITGPLGGEFTGHSWIPIIQGFHFGFVLDWTSCWANTPFAGDFKHHDDNLWHQWWCIQSSLEDQSHDGLQLSKTNCTITNIYKQLIRMPWSPWLVLIINHANNC